ncbi:MAG: hypothetical protein GX804_03890 [Lentisphaerae bacterium]|jgi:hypothetical protein|nr:hypothetical protein [Lentisphaerota bacterium]
MKTQTAEKTDKRIAALAVLSAVWALSILLSVWFAAKTNAANRITERNNELLQRLAPAVISKKKYDEAQAKIVRHVMAAEEDASTISILEEKFPGAQPDSIKESTEIRETTGLRMRTSFMKWKSVEIETLSNIISELESGSNPYRLYAISITPSRRDNIVEAEAEFISFTKPKTP